MPQSIPLWTMVTGHMNATPTRYAGSISYFFYTVFLTLNISANIQLATKCQHTKLIYLTHLSCLLRSRSEFSEFHTLIYILTPNVLYVFELDQQYFWDLGRRRFKNTVYHFNLGNTDIYNLGGFISIFQHCK